MKGDPIWSLLPQPQALAGVFVTFVAALSLAFLRPRVVSSARLRERVMRLCLLGISLHCFHFCEEYLTGFPRLFPESLGLRPFSDEFFVVFNLTWIGIWSWAATGLRRGRALAMIPIWFLSLAMILNGIAHPLLAIRAQGYFPGLWTSPAAGVLGVLLTARLWALTRRSA